MMGVPMAVLLSATSRHAVWLVPGISCVTSNAPAAPAATAPIPAAIRAARCFAILLIDRFPLCRIFAANYAMWIAAAMRRVTARLKNEAPRDPFSHATLCKNEKILLRHSQGPAPGCGGDFILT